MQYPDLAHNVPHLAAVLWSRVEALAERQIEARRHLHQSPEPSGEEWGTTAFVADTLTEAGHSPRTFGDVPGAICDVDLGELPPDALRVAIRGDMDALRVCEEADVPYASDRPGLMHACGHDAHTSLALFAALAAGEVAADWDGPPIGLRFLFQPAEENGKGAHWLCKRGAMKGVSHVLAAHVDPHFPAGEVGVKDGPLTAFCDELHVNVKGRGGHAARPHESRDPLAAACSLVNTLYSLVPRRYDAQQAAVLTFGMLNTGAAPNVIPDSAELRGTLRTFDPAVRDTILRTVTEACAGVGAARAVSIEPKFVAALAGVTNDPGCTAALAAAAADLLGEEAITRLDRPSLGGEDFSGYLDYAPGAMFRLGCAPIDGPDYPLHNPKFSIDERCLAIGTKVLLGAAVRLATRA
ncbi:M20 metallopeptidase family protein [Alienimonas chondri]|uniref:Hydrolase YxeP n=1 Tax=Alienimonas chondri TaxID=2681879 RepID=A0ABX1VCG4_9PLAN|nr:amidohydrolase [Alienimonas chondri]NNJ24917.1 putative hydrolase YxeP [Alienimonas chondri]